MAASKPKPSDESAAGDPAALLWMAPPLIKAALGYSAFAYFIGMITLLLNAARSGFLLPEIPQSEIFTAGVLPTAIVITGVWVSRNVQTMLSPNRPLSTTQVAMDMLKTCFTIGRTSLWTYTLFAFLYFGIRHQISFARSIAPSATDPSTVLKSALILEKVTDWSLNHALWLLIPILLYSWLETVFPEKEDPDSYRLAYFARYAMFGIVLAVVSTYVIFAFPRLPQRYGFGAPARVRLLVAAEYGTVLPLQLASTVPSDKAHLTTPVDLLLKTEKEYIIRYDMGPVNAKPLVVTVSAEAVKGIIWSQ